ncbi:MAG: hypothetical protein KME30_05685 [Iphinoe sp. HA4291-MV1]|jgi:hypothetical protein|nr:hypothetical protein [Iphinoe sp. HA4291-MV1]
MDADKYKSYDVRTINHNIEEECSQKAIAQGHTSDQVEVPDGIHLSFLPSHSPE